MILSQKKSYRNLIISIIIVGIFTLLMIFGLKHNPNFTPSQLIGKSAPTFTAQLSSGETFKSEEIGDKWVVMNFWSSTCYVCREEAHELQDFYQTVSLVNKNNPQLLSINIQDDSQSIRQWQNDFSQTFPVVEDSKGLISVNYGVTGTPETFFIDPNHIVRYRLAGAVTKKIIVHFIDWLDKNPHANENEAAEILTKMSAEG